MHKRFLPFFRSVGLLSIVLANVSSISLVTPKPIAEKPNIIFIFADDQRYNTIRALGNDEIFTPNLDKLVRSGTTFTHAYNMGAWHGAVCVASRAMLVSGLSVWNAQRIEKDYSQLVAAKGFWSQQLKNAGYETYMTGKWHVNTEVSNLFDHVKDVRGGMPNQTPQGYNRPLSRQDTTWQPWKEEYGGFWKGGKHWSEVLADNAIEFIGDAEKKETPFFMYLAFNAPHDPRQAPKKFVDLYPVDKIKIPVSYLDEYPYKDAIGNGKDLRDEQLAPFPRTKYAVQKNIQEYYASISYLDEQIGRILKALAESGKLENTYIFFTADHGLAVGHHGLMGKQSLFDHSTRVPLIVSGPKVPKGEKRSQAVYLQDIAATSYELAGITKPAHVYFTSFWPLINNNQKKGNYENIYGGYMNLQRSVRTETHKLIIFPKVPVVLLYDLKKDPNELNDLSKTPNYQPIKKELLAKLVAQQKVLGDTLDLSSFTR